MFESKRAANAHLDEGITLWNTALVMYICTNFLRSEQRCAVLVCLLYVAENFYVWTLLLLVISMHEASVIQLSSSLC